MDGFDSPESLARHVAGLKKQVKAIRGNAWMMENHTTGALTGSFSHANADPGLLILRGTCFRQTGVFFQTPPEPGRASMRYGRCQWTWVTYWMPVVVGTADWGLNQLPGSDTNGMIGNAIHRINATRLRPGLPAGKDKTSQLKRDRIPMKTQRILPVLTVLFAVLVWGISFVATKVVLADLPPVSIAFLPAAHCHRSPAGDPSDERRVSIPAKGRAPICFLLPLFLALVLYFVL